jgi:molybdopterin-guanine dinucleotide biosynthesis protein B
MLINFFVFHFDNLLKWFYGFVHDDSRIFNRMTPMISIVGYADAGKTTLIEKLVSQLKKRGYRVGTIKHAVHESNLDTRGKDSWRHFAAGADAVVVSSAEKIALIQRREEAPRDSQAELSGLEVFFSGMDIVFAEGYKNARKPKIEIFRSDIHDTPLSMNDQMLVALVTDADIACHAPKFGLDEIDKLVELIERDFLKT